MIQDDKVIDQLVVVLSRLNGHPFQNADTRFLRDALVIIIHSAAGELMPAGTRLGDGVLSAPAPAPAPAPTALAARPGLRPIEVAPGNIQWVPVDSGLQNLDDLLGAGNVAAPLQPVPLPPALGDNPETVKVVAPAPTLRLGRQTISGAGDGSGV